MEYVQLVGDAGCPQPHLTGVGHCYADRRHNLIAVVMALDIHMSHLAFSNTYIFLHVCAREDVKLPTY